MGDPSQCKSPQVGASLLGPVQLEWGEGEKGRGDSQITQGHVMAGKTPAFILSKRTARRFCTREGNSQT